MCIIFFQASGTETKPETGSETLPASSFELLAPVFCTDRQEVVQEAAPTSSWFYKDTDVGFKETGGGHMKV